VTDETTGATGACGDAPRKVLLNRPARGIGRAIAQRLVERGDQVALMDLGGLDALINNAGIRLRGGDGPVDRVSRATWDRTPAVNLTGAFLVRRHAIPGLLAARDSVIVNIASMAGLGSAIPAPTPTVPLKAA
jgi:NAD(P)-dependent dehydrogenase (short-subunit alcohol dehydrogenase family)